MADLPPTIDPSSGPSVGGAERLGSLIGPYKLVRTLGRGGMGMVYRAQQQHPVRRQVALKIIKPGMDSEQAIFRFEAERQALALMDHPNIARVFDAGTTGAGRLYFVMELVEGVPITKYCEAGNVGLRQRLELFIAVCQAIQHAHQKGIVHRDIKPSNILVAVYDGKPAPKVIDFGIAKAVAINSGANSQRLTDHSMYTQIGAVVGTFEYMSPEQAEGGADIDTRSDIYALGVLLYELLTGTTPLERTSLQNLPDQEIVRRIREEEAPRPSARVPDLKLSKTVRGDLDWIAMKGIEKDRQRRYETANGLADDVRRYLNGEAVEARPPSAAYRTAKFARRYRAPLAVAAAFVMLLVAGTIVSVTQAIRATRAEAAARADRDRARAAQLAANRERDRAVAADAQAHQERDAAVAERERANTQAAIATAVSNFVEDGLLAQASARRQFRTDVKPDPDLKVRTALDRAAANIAGKFASQPAVEASIRATIGHSYFDLGLDSPAQQQLEKAVELDRGALGPEHPETLAAMTMLGKVYFLQGKLPQAASVLGQVLAARRRRSGPADRETILAGSELGVIDAYLQKPVEAEALANQAARTATRKFGPEDSITLQVLTNLGNVYMAQEYLRNADDVKKKFLQAEATFRPVLEVRRRVLGSDHPDTLDSMTDLSTTYHRLQRFAEAEKREREIVEIRRRVLGIEDPSTLSSMANLAVDLNRQDKFADAEKINLEILEIRKRVLGPEHPTTLATMYNLANDLRGWRTEDAEQLDLQVLEIRRRILGPEHLSTLDAMGNVAADYRREAKFAQGEQIYRELLDVRTRLQGPEHPSTLGARVELARLYRAESRFAEAEKLDTLSLEISTRLNGPDQGNTQRHKTDLAWDYAFQGKLEAAEPLARQAFESLRRSAGKESPYTLGSADALAIIWRGLGRNEQAEPLIRESLASYEENQPETWHVYFEKCLLGATLSGKDSRSDAESLLLTGYQGLVERKQTMDTPQQLDIPLAAGWIADFYQSWGKADQAAEWRAKTRRVNEQARIR